MTAIADLVAHLVSTGIPPEAIARAVDLAQQHVKESVEIHRNSTGIPPDNAAEKRRAYDRERKRKSAEVPIDASTLLPSSLSDSQEKKEGVVGRARGTRLPTDWLPSDEDFQFAVDLVGGQRAGQEVPKFKDYWQARAGPGGVKLDWHATWRVWIRRAAESGGKSNGSIGKPNRNGITGSVSGDRARELSELALEGEIAAGIRRSDDAF